MKNSRSWFRYHAKTLDSPKVIRLSDFEFRVWTKLLCLAAEDDGFLPKDLPDIALRLRIPEKKAKLVVDSLVEQRFIDQIDGRLLMHDWNEWQFQSDLSTQRVRDFRKRAVAVSRNVSGNEIERSTKRHETVTETPSEQNRAEQRQSVTVSGLKPGAVGDDFMEFQTVCAEVGLPFSDYDLNEARMEWRSLDFEQRLRCLGWLRSSPFDGDPKFRPLPQNVLRKRIWARAVPAAKAPELPLVRPPKDFMA